MMDADGDATAVAVADGTLWVLVAVDVELELLCHGTSQCFASSSSEEGLMGWMDVLLCLGSR